MTVKTSLIKQEQFGIFYLIPEQLGYSQISYLTLDKKTNQESLFFILFIFFCAGITLHI